MIAAAFALLLAVQPQNMRADDPATIVVTAPRSVDVPTVERFVRDVSVTSSGQLASVRAPVCPAVFGLPANYAARVARRIRAVAAQAGLQTAPEGCVPTVALVITNDSDLAIKEMQRLNPRLFYGLAQGEMRQLTRGNDPVRAWNLVEVRNEDGGDLGPGSADDTSAGGGGGPAGDNVMRIASSSIINLPTQRVITQSVVVIDEQATMGKTLTQLADYVVMRAIGGARAGAAGGEGNSILSLFDQAQSAPKSLTSLDLAYLRALNRTPGNQRAVSQMSRISRMISNDLTAPTAAR